MEEIFDIYTRDGKHLWTAPRSVCHSENPGFYHKPARIWIINDDDKILVQKRAATKKNHPNKRDMPSAGHVLAWEKTIDGAIRETHEELGVETKKEDYKFICEYIADKAFEIAQVFLLKLNLDINKFKLTGEGTIDGSEELFYGKVTEYHIEGAYYPRIPLIYIENGKNIEIKDVTLTRSAFWTLHLVGCQNVSIDNIKIKNSPIFTNCDGIDPDHCKNVSISNCDIYCADDCIVLKTTEAFKKYGESSNISVRNCKLKSTSAAIKIGTESVSSFKNISFENIDIY